MPYISGTHLLNKGDNPDCYSKVYRGQYDFAVQGGAQGAIALTGSTGIPSGAVVTGGYIKVGTQCAGVGASIAVGVESTTDVVAATAIASWTTGLKNVLPVAASGSITSTTRILTTAARDITVTISGADLTAGKFDVVLFYNEPLA